MSEYLDYAEEQRDVTAGLAYEEWWAQYDERDEDESEDDGDE